MGSHGGHNHNLPQTPMDPNDDLPHLIGPAELTTDPSEGLKCGQMTKSELILWMTVQYWTEGVLFSFIGAIGFLGNIISICILLTK